MSSLLQAVRTEHPQLGGAAVKPPMKAFTYCSVNVDELRKKGHKLWQSAKLEIGAVGRNI